jgi:hypothetical protein
MSCQPVGVRGGGGVLRHNGKRLGNKLYRAVEDLKLKLKLELNWTPAVTFCGRISRILTGTRKRRGKSPKSSTKLPQSRAASAARGSKKKTKEKNASA